MEKTTKQEMLALARWCGVNVETYSPGDGVTRYRFFIEPTDYFAGSGMGTVLGLKDAVTWLRGYQAAMMIHTQRERDLAAHKAAVIAKLTPS